MICKNCKKYDLFAKVGWGTDKDGRYSIHQCGNCGQKMYIWEKVKKVAWAEIQTITGEMANQTQGKGVTGIGVIDTIIGGTGSVIKLVWNSFDLLGSVVGDTSKTLGLPGWFIGGIIAIVTISLVFTIISIFTRREG